MKNVTKLFKALSDPNRLRIIKMLEVRPLCVCEITDILQLAPSTVSKHLAILRDAGLILDTKQGKWVDYRRNAEDARPQVADLLELLQKWLTDDKVVGQDAEKARSANRNALCGIAE